jgi:peptide/nickel transport system permease protein
MLRYLSLRVLYTLPVIWLVVSLVFLLIHLVPGDPVQIMYAQSQGTTPDQIEAIRHGLGLDQPIYVQYVTFLGKLLHGDLGYTIRGHQPVLDVILQRLPNTLVLAVAAMAVAILIGLPIGFLAAYRRGTLTDTGLMAAAIAGVSIPHFWLGLLLLFTFSVKLGWLPVGGMATIGGGGGVLDILHHLILPTLALGLFYAAIYARVMRSSMLEVAQLDFVRTARAKGLSRNKVTISHVLRNALLPVVTILGVQMGTVLAGSVVIESVFSWPGIGSLLFDSVSSRNYPVVLGILVLGSLVVIAANIAVDLVYMWLDPRIEIR